MTRCAQNTLVFRWAWSPAAVVFCCTTIACATGGVALGGSADRGDAAASGPFEPSPDWNCGTGCYRDDRVPVAVLGALTAASVPDDTLALVYPLSHSLHPVNLDQVTFQFRRASGDQVWFQIHLAAQDTEQAAYDFFVPCLDAAGQLAAQSSLECIYAVQTQYWTAIAQENIGHEVAVSVAATNRAASRARRSPPISFAFSEVPVIGGFYYWSTSLRGTYRLPFGARTAVPWIQPNTPSNQSGCGGCHAVSRNGNVIAFTADAAAGYLRVADAADPTRETIDDETQRNSSMLALNADGSRVLTAYDGVLRLLDAQTGKILAAADRSFFGGGRAAFFPEFSASGRDVVVTLSDVPDSFWAVKTGEIAIIPLSDDHFGEPRVVVSSEDEVSFYPSWSPDEQWIVFVSAPIFSVSYDQPNARLRLVSRDGGRIYELANATQGVGRTSTMPKFAPFVQSGGNVMFFTFNSKLDYGFLLKNSAIDDPASRRPQLWLAAIDLSRLDSGDPSFAPVWLPFQEIEQHNHLGFWTERVSCGEGTEGVAICGKGEICVAGSCQVIVR